MRILIGIVLNLEVILGRIDIFSLLSFLFQDHGNHLFGSLNSLSSVLQFSVYESDTAFIKGIPMYIIF